MYSLYNSNQLLFETKVPITSQLYEDLLVCLTTKEQFDLVEKISDYQLLLPLQTNYPFFTDVMLKQIVAFLITPPRSIEQYDFNKLSKKLLDSLHPYQLDGVKKCLSFGNRALLADEPGLGKTIQSIAWASMIATKKTLIVAPPTLLQNWQDELNKWLDKPKIQKIEGDTTQLNKEVQWYIISNALVGLESSSKRLLLQDIVTFDTMIVDEAHAYITPNSQRSKSMLASTIPNVLFITGTPLLAKHVQLFVLIKKLYPEWVRLGYYEYTKRFCNGQKGQYGWEANGSTNHEELFGLLNKKMVRRFYDQVQSEIPPLTVSTIMLELSKADLVSYEIVLETEKSIQQRVSSKSKENSLNHIQMEKHRVTSRIKTQVVSSIILKLCENYKKVIIWYKYDAMRDSILAQLPLQQTLTIGGDTPNNKRQSIINQFSLDENRKYLVLSIMACNSGLNITCAELAIFADNDHTPSILLQCMKRKHRIGQKKPTHAIFLIAKNTYDETLLNTLNRKDTLVNKTLKEDRKFVIQEKLNYDNKFTGWEFEPYGISAPQVRLLSKEEQNAYKPLLGETQEAYILRVTREVYYDPEFISYVRRNEFSNINQLNLNGFAKWVNILEYDKALPLPNEEKTMRILENIDKTPIAIFMQKKDLL